MLRRYWRVQISKVSYKILFISNTVLTFFQASPYSHISIITTAIILTLILLFISNLSSQFIAIYNVSKMYHSSVFAFPFLMAIAQAMTLPSPGSSALAARDNIGVKVGFSDDTFEWGTTNPVDVVNMLYQECYDSGICNPEGYTANTNLPMNAGGNQILAAEILSVTFHNADYAIWVKNGMVAALATAVEQVMTSKVGMKSPLVAPTCQQPMNC